jgi:hypothetical protein
MAIRINTFKFKFNDSTRALRFTPISDLTDAGGHVALNLNTEGNGSGGVECFNCSPFRLINGGSLDSPVPEPATEALTSLGLLGLFVVLKKFRVN